MTLPPLGDYGQDKPLGGDTSPPFSESAKLILKVSHNCMRALFPLLLATRHKKTHARRRLRLQAAFLAKAGVDVATDFVWRWSGGDRGDYVTPAATVALLRHMYKHRDFTAYREALPVLGVDGTLAKAVRADSPARGKVRAKTAPIPWANV